jgi:hypothetical protein
MLLDGNWLILLGCPFIGRPRILLRPGATGGRRRRLAQADIPDALHLHAARANSG